MTQPTPTPLTTDELAAMQARCDKATPEPWMLDGGSYHDDYRWYVRCNLPNKINVVFSKDNAEFIAHAREDVPRLIAEVQRLRALVDDAEVMASICSDRQQEAESALETFEQYDGDADLWDKMKQQRDAALAEVQRLQDWKQSAMSVLTEWDKVFESLGSPGQLGSSKAASALTEVQRLRALVAEAEPQTGDNP